jgi:hypothetical protein
MFAHLPMPEVLECLELIEEEYPVPPGLLRPNDELKKLFDPVITKNPWRWLVYQGREGDRESEISYQLDKKLKAHGTRDLWVRNGVRTVDDLLRAWCGLKPD